MAASLPAEPLRWIDLNESTRAVLAQAGLVESEFPAWLARHNSEARSRLAAGAAEHAAYFLLQSRQLTSDPPLDPAQEARKFLNSLNPAAREAFLNGATPAAPISEPVRRRMDAFWKSKPATERHRILREMASRLEWPPEEIVYRAFRFLMRRSGNEDPDHLFQRRGLSADPFPPSMLAVQKGLEWLYANRAAARPSVLLAGPGAELGSRFGIDDTLPVISPQPAALVSLLPNPPAVFDCVDIRQEVVDSLRRSPCGAIRLDLVSERISHGRYDLAIATNLLVYLDDLELAVALANLSGALKPGGCLLHNDSRFAARPLGLAASLPVVHFQPVSIGTRQGREQLDRIVVHCKP